jgi:hypothetical protein
MQLRVIQVESSSTNHAGRGAAASSLDVHVRSFDNSTTLEPEHLRRKNIRCFYDFAENFRIFSGQTITIERGYYT